MSPTDTLRLSDYLSHILDAISRCVSYVDGLSYEEFLSDSKTQDAVIRTFEVIGEAANNIRKRFPEFATAHPELALPMAIGMRNVLAHGYFKVDLMAIWKTIHQDLPRLESAVSSVRAGL